MNLTRILNQRRGRKAARRDYYAIDENPRTDAARTTLRRTSDPTERYHALDYLAARELGLYRTHDAAFGRQPWDDIAGDAATGLAHGAMILRLLAATERARVARTLWTLDNPSWSSHWQPAAWGRNDLASTEQSLADICGPILDRLVTEDSATETAVLYARLWIAAYPVIGGQGAEWIASIGNDWQCRAAGVVDGPDTVLIVPNDRRGDVQFLPATN